MAIALNEKGRESKGFIGSALPELSGDWFAVYTKPQQEHIALRNLEAQSFECYLPLVENARQRRGSRNAPQHVPFFPRYLFLKADSTQQSLASVNSTRGVAAMVRTGLEPTRIRASIVTGLRTLSNPVTGLISIDSIGLSSGDKVRIFDGPFADLEGIFKEYRGQSRSLLLLEILGRETAVEIDERLLQQVN